MTRFGLSISFLILIVLIGGGFLVFKSSRNVTETPLITNFEECAKAGYPVMESYPAKCRVPNGELFMQVIENTNVPPSKIAAGYVGGHVNIGPFCPVEREGEPCKIPPQAYTSRKVVIYENDSITVKEKANLDTQGNYKIALMPGNYFIQIEPAGIGPGEKKFAIIKPFETTIIDFDIDTGIR